jgi:hypothetical protein
LLFLQFNCLKHSWWGASRSQITFRHEIPSNMAQAVTLRDLKSGRFPLRYPTRTPVPMWFFATPRWMSCELPWKGHVRFLPHPFQFIRHTHPSIRRYTCTCMYMYI